MPALEQVVVAAAGRDFVRVNVCVILFGKSTIVTFHVMLNQDSIHLKSQRLFKVCSVTDAVLHVDYSVIELVIATFPPMVAVSL